MTRKCSFRVEDCRATSFSGSVLQARRDDRIRLFDSNGVLIGSVPDVVGQFIKDISALKITVLDSFLKSGGISTMCGAEFSSDAVELEPDSGFAVFKGWVKGVEYRNDDDRTDRQNILSALLKDVEQNDRCDVLMFRETSNQHDPNAISVRACSLGRQNPSLSFRVGYIDRGDAAEIARLLQDGCWWSYRLPSVYRDDNGIVRCQYEIVTLNPAFVGSSVFKDFGEAKCW